jgi:hypothetical protein
MDGRLGPSALHETQGAVESKLESKLEAFEQRLKSVPVKLPVAKTWHPESVTYQSEFVSHDGALWQARKDTAQTPGGSDWICATRAGRDAITPTVLGTYSVDENYKLLDIVAMDGGAFIARKDHPGVCPGPDWQMIAQRGKPGRLGATGPRGPQGEKGEPGKDGAKTVSYQLDRAGYRMSPLLNDGTVGEMMEFRAFFEQFLVDRGEQMVDRPKSRMSVAQRIFMAGVRYGYQRALKRQRHAEGLVDEMHDELSAAEALQQALDGDFDPETPLN